MCYIPSAKDYEPSAGGNVCRSIETLTPFINLMNPLYNGHLISGDGFNLME